MDSWIEDGAQMRALDLKKTVSSFLPGARGRVQKMRFCSYRTEIISDSRKSSSCITVMALFGPCSVY